MGQVLRAVPSPSQGETGHQLRGVSAERERVLMVVFRCSLVMGEWLLVWVRSGEDLNLTLFLQLQERELWPLMMRCVFPQVKVSRVCGGRG